MVQLSSSNTDKVTQSDRVAVGPKQDNSKPDGSTDNGSVSNAQLAAMPSNTVKANATGNSVSPQDVVLNPSTILARLASGNMVAANAVQVKQLLGLSNGLSVSITTAQLTSNGAPGSMVFSNGILTASTAAT